MNTTLIFDLSNPDRLRRVSLHRTYGPRELGLTFVDTIWLRHNLPLLKFPVGKLFQECDNPDFPNPSVRVRVTKGIITYQR